MEQLTLKVELLERTLSVFQKDVDSRMQIVEKILSTRCEQFAAQKNLMEREELLYQALINGWKNTVDELQNGQTQNSFEEPIPLYVGSAEFNKTRSQLNQAADERSSDQTQKDVNNRRSPFRNNQADETDSYPSHNREERSKLELSLCGESCDPLRNSASENNDRSRYENNSEYDESEGSRDIAYSSPHDKPDHDDRDRDDIALSDASDRERSHMQGHPTNGNNDQNDYEDDDDEQELEVVDMKFTVTANEGVENRQDHTNSIDSSQLERSITRSRNIPSDRSMQPNLDLLLPAGRAGTSRSSSTVGPTMTNLYSSLRNKYKHKRTNVVQNPQYFPTIYNSQISQYQYQQLHHQPSFRSLISNTQSTSSFQAQRSSTPPTTSTSTNSCPDCGKTFIRSGLLKHHREEEVCSKCFECSVCDASQAQYFNDRHAMEMHMLVVHKLRKFRVCQFCRKCFGPFRGLLEHQLEQHPELAAKQATKFKHQCMLCPKSYSTRNDLVCHSRLHTGERPFSCSACKKTFTDNRNLRKHRNTCSQRYFPNPDVSISIAPPHSSNSSTNTITNDKMNTTM